MRAVVAVSGNQENPFEGFSICDHPDPVVPEGWVRVAVKAAAINHHDVWTLRGVATAPENLPIVLGSDAAGTLDDGTAVIVHAVLGDPSKGDETLDPKRSLLSEVHDGTHAEFVTVPAYNVIPKPDFLTYEEAACLPTAWLTAYRMLFTKSGLKKGDTVLIQGAGGGVATAPGKGDSVMKSVGEATWSHSMRSLRPGGKIVICGATSGANPPADLNRLFFLQLEVVGSTMGTRTEFEGLLKFLGETGVRPHIQQVLSLEDAKQGYELMHQGDIQGKLVIVP